MVFTRENTITIELYWWRKKGSNPRTGNLSGVGISNFEMEETK